MSNDMNDWAANQSAQVVAEYVRVMVPLYRGRKAQDEGEVETANLLFDEALKHAKVLSSAQGFFLEASVHGYRKNYSEAAAAFQRYLDQGGPTAGFGGKMAQVMQKFSGARAPKRRRASNFVIPMNRPLHFLRASKPTPRPKNIGRRSNVWLASVGGSKTNGRGKI